MPAQPRYMILLLIIILGLPTTSVNSLSNSHSVRREPNSANNRAVTNLSTEVRANARRDRSKPLRTYQGEILDDTESLPLQSKPTPTPLPPMPPISDAGRAVEQTVQGDGQSIEVAASFDGLGFGFAGPQGVANLRNPSDNSLAVGPNHIVQIVNTRMAIFTKQGRRYPESGKVLFGPVVTRAVFAGFGGQCESRNNGDAVVRYDQLAKRWLIVMPIFARGTERPDQPQPGASGGTAHYNPPGNPNQPQAAVQLVPPTTPNPADPNRASASNAGKGPYSMCYAVSVSDDPMGSYYRYEFLRAYFPDYPRPAVWLDGYYNPTSTSDDLIQKHACVVERNKMLAGLPAREQCFVIDGVNFLNNADIDGYATPPAGAPNIMMAAGGAQLKNIRADDQIFYWKFHVDWDDPLKSKIDGPHSIRVAPYQYLCGGQLTNCVPQPNSTSRLDSQGDKIMARLVYRKIKGKECLVAVHSVNTAGGAGGVRWYELRLNKRRDPELHQQGTYAPDISYRWMASPAMDRFGNIGVGYSFGGSPYFPGQRFAGRLADDPPGRLTLKEQVLASGEGSQNVMRWQDYTQTAVDPSDDCTIWYVGDYLKKDAPFYTSRIGAFRMGACMLDKNRKRNSVSTGSDSDRSASRFRDFSDDVTSATGHQYRER